MVFVLNKCYGGFSLSPFAVERLGVSDPYADLDSLQIDALAALIAEYGSEKCSGSFAKLKVVEVPDTITDWIVQEYDGIEVLIYVLDGKIYQA